MKNANALRHRQPISEAATSVINGKSHIRQKNPTCPIANADTIRTSVQSTRLAFSFISQNFHLHQQSLPANIVPLSYLSLLSALSKSEAKRS